VSESSRGEDSGQRKELNGEGIGKKKKPKYESTLYIFSEDQRVCEKGRKELAPVIKPKSLDRR